MLERLLTNRVLSMSLVAIAVAAVMVVFQLPGLSSALMVPGINNDKTPKKLETSLANHETESRIFRDRFVGRSIFFMPDPPPVVVARKPDLGDNKPPPPPPPDPDPVKPDTYGGPEILALIGDEVHVTGPKTLKLGVEDASLGLKVIEFVPPWSVKVEWLKKPGNYAKGEYVVEMFQRDYEFAKAEDEKDSSSVPDGLSQSNDKAAAVESSHAASPQLVED